MDPEFAKDADDDKGSQFYVECGILSCAVEFAISTEFLSFFVKFCGTRHWLGDKFGIFSLGSGGHRKLITICTHDCVVKCMSATSAVMGGILKILVLSTILPVYLVDRLLILSVAVTRDKYCIFGWI